MKKITSMYCWSGGCNIGLLLFIIGAVWFIKEVTDLPIPLWPLIFIVIGLSIILNSIGKRTY